MYDAYFLKGDVSEGAKKGGGEGDRGRGERRGYVLRSILFIRQPRSDLKLHLIIRTRIKLDWVVRALFGPEGDKRVSTKIEEREEMEAGGEMKAGGEMIYTFQWMR